MIKAGAVSPGTAVLSVGVGAGFGTLGCQAGGLGSSASLSTDNDDERLKLCNEMGVLGRKVAAGVLAVATFESVRPGRHEIVVGVLRRSPLTSKTRPRRPASPGRRSRAALHFF